MADSNNVLVIERAFAILDVLFSANEPMGISALAAELNLPKGSAFRILTTLCECGAVHKDENDLYRLGVKFIQYGEKVRSDTTIHTLAQPVITKLRDRVKETVNLGVLYENYVLSIITLPGDSFIITSRALPITPLHCSSSGKLFLSYMEEGDIKAYFAAPHPRNTVNTITTFEAFLPERKAILAEEIAYDREEYEYGLFCVGAPIFGQNKKPVATISISGPKSRMELKGIAWLTGQVSESARELTGLIGAAKFTMQPIF